MSKLNKHNTFWLFSIFIILGILLTFLFWFRNVTGIFQDRYIRALKQISKQNYETSVKQLTKIIYSHLEDYRPYRKLAEVYHLENDLSKGINFYSIHSKENPENICKLYGKGYLYQLFNEHEKAISEYLKCIAFIPQYTTFYKDFIDNCAQMNKLSLADSILTGLGNDTNNVYILYARGYLLFKDQQWDDAIEKLDQALILQDDIPDVYNIKGAVYWTIGEYNKFLETSLTGLRKSKQQNNIRYQSIFNGNIGLAYNYTGNYKQAIKSAKKAIKLAKRAGERQEEVRSLGNLGIGYRDSQQYSRAIKCMEKALRGAIEIKDRYREGLFYRNIGSVYQMKGDYNKAVSCYNKSLPIAIDIGNKYTQCLTLLSMGLAKWNMSEYGNAIRYYNRSVKIAKETNNIWAEGRCYSSIGLIYWEQGLYAKALEYTEKSLKIANKINDNEGKAYCLGNLAIIYDDIGEMDKTLEYYKLALELSEKIGNKGEIARNLGNLGCINHKFKNFDAAFNYYKKAIKIFHELDDQKSLAVFYGNLGALMIESGNYKEAEQNLAKALQIAKKTEIDRTIAEQLISFGFFYYKLNHFDDAFQNFNEARKLAQKINASQIYWLAQSGLGMVCRSQSKPKEALGHYIKAVEKIEGTQRMLPIEQFQSGFLDENMSPYVEIISLLSEMYDAEPAENYDKRAFYFAERAKARSFLQNLIESRTSINNEVPGDLKQREQKILKNISEKQKQLFTENPGNRERRKLLSELKEYENDFEKIKREIKSANPKYMNLYSPEPCDVEKIQKDILQPGDVLLEYSVQEQGSHVWLLSKNKFCYFELPCKDSITKAVENYLYTIDKPAGISNSFSNHIIKGKELFDLILKPCLKEINKHDHLIIVADDILHFLPFESLVKQISKTGNTPTYLIEEHSISYSPSATSLAFLSYDSRIYERQQKQLLAFADPVFKKSSTDMETRGRLFRSGEPDTPLKTDDETGIFNRNRTSGYQFSAISYTGTEVKEISGLFPKDETVCYFGTYASEYRLKTEQLDQYKYLHFATHGLIDESKAFRSGIVLSTNKTSSEDGLLQVNEILNLKLHAEMVVLSACQTARGKLYQAEGIVGISRSFIYAGSSSVVVSLWNINDRSTSFIMKEFYTAILNNQNKSQALQSAQLSMLRSDRKLYRHPYYWAPFILIGNYR